MYTSPPSMLDSHLPEDIPSSVFCQSVSISISGAVLEQGESDLPKCPEFSLTVLGCQWLTPFWKIGFKHQVWCGTVKLHWGVANNSCLLYKHGLLAE